MLLCTTSDNEMTKKRKILHLIFFKKQLDIYKIQIV
jgi:hypothetical protein